MNWPILLIAYFSLFVLGLADNVRGPVYPDILTDLGLSNSEGSLIFSIAALTSFLGAFACRWLFKFWNSYIGLKIGLVFIALGVWGFGFFGTYKMILWFSCLFGLGYGILGVCQNVLVKRSVSIEYLGRAFSGLHSMYGIASLTGPFLVWFFLKSGFDWRGIFLSITLVPLILLLVMFWVKFEPIRSVDKVESIQGLRIHLHQMFFALMMSVYVLTEVMISTRLSLYLTLYKGLSTSEASLYVMIFFSLLFIGRLSFALIKWPAKNSVVMSFSLILSVLIMILGFWYEPYCVVLTGLTMAPFFPIALARCTEIFGEHVDIALSYIISFMSVGIVIMHTLVGVFTDIWSLETVLRFGPFLLLIVFVLRMIRTIVFKNYHSLND